MNQSEFLLLLDELLELPPGTLRADSALADNNWDSLAVVGFIAMVDEHFGAAVPASKIAKCVTAKDLIDLLQGHVIPVGKP